jgi:cytochrome P450
MLNAETSASPDAAAPIPGTSGPGIVPPHVPSELVFTPDYENSNRLDDPFSVTRNIYKDLPPIFYWPRPYPGRYDGTWVVTQAKDIREVYQNDALYSTEGGASFQIVAGETFKMLPLAVDPPEHGKYRRMLNPWFSPKAVKAMEPQMNAVINELIDGFVEKGRCDVAYDFGRVYPVRVFLDLMGFDQDKIDEFLDWEYSILHARADIEKVKYGVHGALGYLRDFIVKARADSKDGLGSFIVHAKIDDRPLTEDEIIGNIFFLWVGGLDTVAATTALMFRRLAIETELQDALRQDPSLIPNAIEEFLRIQPVINSSRRVKRDHAIHGVKLRAGEHVMCYNLAGNFDPDEFPSPREVRFDRFPNRHLSFASGAHRCLGSHVARRELAIALGEFLRRVPSFTLDPEADRAVYPNLRATLHVPIVWR